MSIESQKQIADAVLSKLEAIDPFCIVAGGAPRDWFFGKEAMDIDVFLYTPSKQISAIKRQLKALGFEIESIKTGENLPINYKMNPYLQCVYNLKGFDTPVQVMIMNEPTFKSVVPTFALSICQAWYKDEKLHAEKDFGISVKHNVIFKTNEVYNNEHTYLQKILAKFPEYRYYNSKLEFLETLI